MSQLARSCEPQSFAVQRLHEHFDDAEGVAPNHFRRALVEPLSDFLSRPGKAFRARMVGLAWELCARRAGPPPELPLLVEAIHAGSLIVDDIEDGSAYRRGGRALHLEYGLPKALNAGCWLYFWSADLLAQLELPPATELALHRVIGKAMLACHEGQALDLGSSVLDLPQAEVEGLVVATTRLKTGKLFELAAAVGAIAAGAPSSAVRALAEFGMALGVGLQMLDDLGGLVSTERCHKGHEDLLGARPTWPWAWAARLADAHTFARLCALEAQVRAGEQHPEHLASELRQLVEAHGRAHVSSWLAQAFNDLSQKFAPCRALDEARREVEALERSYG
ncbi:MAG: polyprenyl synthetase family protein [Polyangiaceae bacterium]